MAEVNRGYALYTEGIQFLGKGKVQTEDFKRRLFDLDMEYLSFYRCRQLPTPPQVVQDLHAKQMGDPDYQVKEDFWRQGVVWRWLEARELIVGQNRGYCGHLVEICQSPFASTEQKTKILGMIKEFTSFYEEECKRSGYKPIETPTMPEIGESEEKIDITQDILDVADIFGGDIIQ